MEGGSLWQILFLLAAMSLAGGAIAKIIIVTADLRQGRKEFFGILKAHGLDPAAFPSVKTVDIGTQLTIPAPDSKATPTAVADVLYLLDNRSDSDLTAELVLGTKGISIATSFPDATAGNNTGCTTMLFLVPVFLISMRGWFGKLLLHVNHVDIREITSTVGTNSITIHSNSGYAQIVNFLDEAKKDVWLETWRVARRLAQPDALRDLGSGMFHYPLTILPKDSRIVDAAGNAICQKAGNDLEFNVGATRSHLHVKGLGSKEIKVNDRTGNTLATYARDSRTARDSLTLLDGAGNMTISTLAMPRGQVGILVNDAEYFRILRIQDVLKPQFVILPAESGVQSQQHEFYILLGTYLLLLMNVNVPSL